MAIKKQLRSTKHGLSRREEYARYLGISKEKLDTIDVNLELMNLEINRLEKELSETTKDFARDYEEELYTWKDVRSVLQENDVALEIIRVSHFDHILTDSIIYAALVVTKETKGNPSIVLLPNGTELEGRDFKFFRNGIKYKTIDEVSYKKYWARIESEFGLRTNIYISPDGVYNQINPETFYRENYGYLISGYRFNSTYNTKDLVIAKIESSYKATSSDAILVGNPNFGNHTGEQSITSVEPLPGAEKEVQEVGILLASNNWIVQEITGDQAGEDEIKSVESPRILHLATHGFFMEDEQFGRSGSDKIITEFDRDKPDNMMLKSGLLMAGADSLLVKAEEDINELNSASGVLTAYEAVHLNLDNTELVILSACETGRGEIASRSRLGRPRARMSDQVHPRPERFLSAAVGRRYDQGAGLAAAQIPAGSRREREVVLVDGVAPLQPTVGVQPPHDSGTVVVELDQEG